MIPQWIVVFSDTQKGDPRGFFETYGGVDLGSSRLVETVAPRSFSSKTKLSLLSERSVEVELDCVSVCSNDSCACECLLRHLEIWMIKGQYLN